MSSTLSQTPDRVLPSRPKNPVIGIYLFAIAYGIAGIWILITDVLLLAGMGGEAELLTGRVSFIHLAEAVGPVLGIVLTPITLLLVAFGTWRGWSWARYFGLGTAASMIVIACTGNYPIWTLMIAAVVIIFFNLPTVKLHFASGFARS